MSCCETAFSTTTKIEEWEIQYSPIVFYIFLVKVFKRGFMTGTHPVDRESFIMVNIGGPSTGSSSFSSLVGIASSMQLDGLEAITIFMNLTRDTGFF